MSNPFDLDGLGGLMQGFQQNIQRMKAEAEAARVEGQAGGGLVRVVATGTQEIVSVSIAEACMDDREMLEDLIHAATNDALRQAREVMSEKMSALTGGLPLPPGLF